MPFLVPPLLNIRSGVDYLNLRQVNLDLMAELVPGLNNVTRYVRPYSIMCWTHWKFSELLEATERTEVLPSEIRRFKEKVETLVTWGHQLLKIRGLPGMDAKPPKPTTKGVSLDFKSWKRQATNTSLQAAVQYGPSLSDLGGLGFLTKIDRRAYKVTPEGRELAQALDARLRRSEHYDLLEDLNATHAHEDQARELCKHWRVDAASGAERSVFGRVLYDPDVRDDDSPDGRRSAFISLVCHVLARSPKPVDEEHVRQSMMLQRWTAQRPFKLSPGEDRCARVWRLLQFRQLQRLALERWLGWLEFELIEHSVRQPDDLVGKTVEGVIDGFKEQFEERVTTVQDALDLIDPDASSLEHFAQDCLSRAEWFDPETLMTELAEAEWEDVPFLCCYHLLLLWRLRPLLESDDLLRSRLKAGGSARLSMAHWISMVEAHRERPFHDLCDAVVKNLLISQHLFTATQRYDGERLRHRFVLEQEGLDALIDKPSRARPTSDRLGALLELMRHTGMISANEEGYSLETA